MNKIRKGMNAESEYEKIMKRDNYEYVWKTTRNKWNNLDFYGLFDLVGINGKNRCYVQVKSMKRIPTENDFNMIETSKGKYGINISDFVKTNLNEYESVEIAIRVNACWRGRGKNRYYQKPMWKIKTIFMYGNYSFYERECI